MIEVHYEMYHPTQQSPCRGCDREYNPKSKCASTCEKITLYQKEMSRMEICKICNENEADHPRRGGWCKGCAAKGMRKAKKKAPKKGHKIRADCLNIYGARGLIIMDKVAEIAAQEMRSMNSQALHMLSWCLKEKYGVDIEE